MDVILLIIGAIAALIGFGMLFGAKPKSVGVTGFVGCALVACIAAALAFSYRLAPNEVGVSITFGKIGSVEGPGGLHSKAPWTSVQKMTVYPFTADPVDYTLRNKDGGEFAARFVVRWHTDAEHAVALYKQNRTSDEQEITNKVVNNLLSGIASDTAKGLRNENVMAADGKTVTEEGVATMSTLVFAKRVQEALAPKLAAKGIAPLVKTAMKHPAFAHLVPSHQIAFPDQLDEMATQVAAQVAQAPAVPQPDAPTMASVSPARTSRSPTTRSGSRARRRRHNTGRRPGRS